MELLCASGRNRLRNSHGNRIVCACSRTRGIERARYFSRRVMANAILKLKKRHCSQGIEMLREYAQYNVENENAALYYNMVYRTQSRNAHPELFGDSVWHNSFYRRLSDGEESLKRKRILDKDRNPTDLAYQSLSSETSKDMLKKLREESMKMAAKNDELERKISELRARCQDLQKMEKYRLINEIVDKFSSLGVDENWIVVLISTNLVEQAMKKKLEKLGMPIKTTNGKRPCFADIVQSLGEALQAKENRSVRTLVKPRPLYDIRNEIDHAGYQMKISQEQAQAIFVLVKDLVDDLRL